MKSVFQAYRYAYTSKNINKIVTSVRADIMIILGVADTNYTWNVDKEDAASFTAGLTSLLTAAENAGIPRVVYLSSTDIFETNTQSPLTVDMEPEAESVHIRVMVRGEEICQNFREKIGVGAPMEIKNE